MTPAFAFALVVTNHHHTMLSQAHEKPPSMTRLTICFFLVNVAPVQVLLPPGTTPSRDAKRCIFRRSDARRCIFRRSARLDTRPPRGGDDRLPHARDRTRNRPQEDGSLMMGEGGNLLREGGNMRNSGACDVHLHSAGAGASGQP
jgi:hypothetical protein